MSKRDTSAHAFNSRLKISRRVKTGCCYRLTTGRRRGQMCGEYIESLGMPTDFCPMHALKVLRNR